jgi:hypothetical protein
MRLWKMMIVDDETMHQSIMPMHDLVAVMFVVTVLVVVAAAAAAVVVVVVVVVSGVAVATVQIRRVVERHTVLRNRCGEDGGTARRWWTKQTVPIRAHSIVVVVVLWWWPWSRRCKMLSRWIRDAGAARRKIHGRRLRSWNSIWRRL